MALPHALTDLLHRLRRHPASRALRTTVGRRALVLWGSGRRAWRRSLQLRMVTITLVLSTVLVGAFGVLVASQITRGLVNNTVNKALVKLKDGRDNVVIPQLSGVTDQSAPAVTSAVSQLLLYLGSNPAQGPDVIVALTSTADSKVQIQAQSAPVVTSLGTIIPPDLARLVGKGKVGHQFITANPLGHGDQPYLVVGTPVPVPVGTFALYYVFPLDVESDAADLVRTTVIVTGAALVLLLALLTALITRLVVRPVRTAARTAQRFSLGLFDQRMEVHGEDDLAMLAASFNQMAENLQRQIARLEEMSRLQRRFTSDVSHELRTPLTTVRMAADLIFSAREDF